MTAVADGGLGDWGVHGDFQPGECGADPLAALWRPGEAGLFVHAESESEDSAGGALSGIRRLLRHPKRESHSFESMSNFVQVMLSLDERGTTAANRIGSRG